MSGPEPVYHTKPGSGSYHSSSSPPPNIPYESYIDTNPIATPPVPHSPTQTSQYPPAGYMNQMNTSPTPPPLQHPAPVAAYPNQTPQNVQVAYPSPPETYQAVQAPYHSPQNSYHSQQPSESAPPQSPQYFLPQQAQPPQGQVSYATPQYIAPPPQTMSPTGMHPTMQVAMSPTYQNGSPAPQMQTPQVSTKHLLAFFFAYPDISPIKSHTSIRKNPLPLSYTCNSSPRPHLLPHLHLQPQPQPRPKMSRNSPNPRRTW